MPRLVLLSEGFAGTAFELKAEKTTVGRVSDNNFEIPESSVSSHHAEIILRGSEVLIRFKKNRHQGVWIEGQAGAETDWTYLAIDTGSPYNDARPLKVAGQPEKRRYRLCLWDGDPTRVWSPVFEVTFGG